MDLNDTVMVLFVKHLKLQFIYIEHMTIKVKRRKIYKKKHHCSISKRSTFIYFRKN